MVINEDIELGNSAIIRKNISKSFCYLEILYPTHFFLETILIFKEHTVIDEFRNKYHKKKCPLVIGTCDTQVIMLDGFF